MRSRTAKIEAVDSGSHAEAIFVDLTGQQLAVEDVAAGKAEHGLEIGRRQYLTVFDRAGQVGRICGELRDHAVGDRIAVAGFPRPIAPIVRKVLREDREDVFSRGRQ